MATKGIVINISGSGEGAVEALRQIEAKMQETAVKGKEAGESLAKSMREFQEGIMLLRDAFLLDRAFETIKGFIERSVDLGVELGHLSQQTGISTENLSVLRFTAQQTGVDFDTLTRGFKKLSTTVFEVHEGSKLATDTFKDLGISQKDLGAAGNDMYKVMTLVADKFKEMPDGIQKNALATQLFGRASGALIPILNQGAAGLEKYQATAKALGIVLDEDGIKKIEDLHQAMATLSAQVEVGSARFTIALAPALEGVASAFSGAIKGTDLWTQAGKQAGLTVLPLAAVFVKLGTAIRETGDELKNLNAAGNYIQSGLDMHLDIGEGARQRARDLHEQARKELHDSKLDHDAAEAEEARFMAAMKSLKEQIQNGTATSSLTVNDSPNREGVGNGFGPPPEKGDGITALDRAFWLSNPRSVLEAYRENQREITAAALQTQQDAIEAARKQLYPDVAPLPDAIKAKLPPVSLDNEVPGGQSPIKGSQLGSEAAQASAKTITGFMDRLSEQAIQGRVNFRSLVDGVVSDLERFAMKVVEERTLLPLLNSLFGGLGSGGGFNAAGYSTAALGSDGQGLFAGGGDIDHGWAVVGDGGDGSGSELFAPKGPGTILPHDVLQGLANAKSGGGGGSPSVTINNINNSSSQVQMRQGGVSYDAQAKQFVIHTVLEDMNQGGPLSSAMSGFAPK